MIGNYCERNDDESVKKYVDKDVFVTGHDCLKCFSGCRVIKKWQDYVKIKVQHLKARKGRNGASVDDTKKATSSTKRVQSKIIRK